MSQPSLPGQKTLAKMALLFGSVQIATVGAGIIRNKVAAMTVGAAGVGVMALFLTITALVANFASMGVINSGTQAMAKAYGTGDESTIRSTIAKLRMWEIVSGTIAFLIIALASPLICRVYFGGWTENILSVLTLSLAPAFSIVSGIEQAILKGLQRNRMLSYSILINALTTILVAVPLYIVWGYDVIALILTLSMLGMALTSSYFGHKANNAKPDLSVFAFHRHSWSCFTMLWKTMQPLVALGGAFIVSALCASGSELLLQSYFSTISTFAIVGLYKAGYQMSITYPSLIFTAVENDFFPRLSAISDDVKARNALVTRQIRVLLLIATPLILVFILLLPWIIPLMLSNEFDEIVPMVRIGALAIIARCVALPINYLPLALNRPRDFILVDIVSYTGLVVCVIAGCHVSNLVGVGGGILASVIFDAVFAYVFCRVRYGFRFHM